MEYDYLVSVIIPVYNAAKTLFRCINCITNQTYNNLEIIIIDDGSTDGSDIICDELAKGDPRIKVVHKANGGLGSARNAGVKIANGDYIEFVDSDDWIALDTVEYCLEIINHSKQKIDVVQFAMIETSVFPTKHRDKKNNVTLLSKRDKLFYFMYKSTKSDLFFSACRCLYSKEAIKDHCFSEGKVNEDISWKYKIIRDCNTFLDSNQIKYFYYQSTGSITTEKLKKKDFDLYVAATELKDLTSKEKDKRVIRLGKVKYARTSFSLLCKIIYYGIDETLDKKKTVKQLQKELRSNLILLITSPIKITRKILAISLSINYFIAEKTIRLIKSMKII